MERRRRRRGGSTGASSGRACAASSDFEVSGAVANKNVVPSRLVSTSREQWKSRVCVGRSEFESEREV